MNNGKNVDSANLCMVFSVSLVFCLATIGVGVFRCADFGWRTFNFGRIYMDAFTFGAIIGSILSGAAVGAVPAICGAIKHKIGLAIGGFFACLVASFLLGLILSVPTCAVFLFLIFKKEKSAESNSVNTEGSNNNFGDN